MIKSFIDFLYIAGSDIYNKLKLNNVERSVTLDNSLVVPGKVRR